MTPRFCKNLTATGEGNDSPNGHHPRTRMKGKKPGSLKDHTRKINDGDGSSCLEHGKGRIPQMEIQKACVKRVLLR